MTDAKFDAKKRLRVDLDIDGDGANTVVTFEGNIIPVTGASVVVDARPLDVRTAGWPRQERNPEVVLRIPAAFVDVAILAGQRPRRG